MTRAITPAALVQAAEDAAAAASRLEDADIDPTIPLLGYPQPLRDIRDMIGSASETAYRLAAMAADLIPDAGLADGAQGMLREASKRAGAASDRAEAAAGEIGRILRRAGEEARWERGWLGSRLGQAAHAAQIDLSYLDSATDRARRADPGPSLLTVTMTAQWHASTLESLAVTCGGRCGGAGGPEEMSASTILSAVKSEREWLRNVTVSPLSSVSTTFEPDCRIADCTVTKSVRL